MRLVSPSGPPWSDRLANVYQFDLRNSIAYVFSNQFSDT